MFKNSIIYTCVQVGMLRNAFTINHNTEQHTALHPNNFNRSVVVTRQVKPGCAADATGVTAPETDAAGN